MYLTARYYYGGKWKEPGHDADKGHTLEISGEFAKKTQLTAGKVQEITEEVGIGVKQIRYTIGLLNVHWTR